MRYYSNTSKDMTLVGAIDTVVTTMIVDDASGLPLQYPYNLAIDAGLSTVEIVEVTAAAGNTLTIVRGRQDTSAKAHSVGAVIYHAWTALEGQELQNHLAASQNVHGVGGTAAVVGTNTAQVLTNKTIDAAQNTITNISNAAILDVAGSKITGSITTATIPGANVVNPLQNVDINQTNGADYALDVNVNAAATTHNARIYGRDGQDALQLRRNNSNTSGNLLNFVSDTGTSLASVSRAGNFATQSVNATGNVTATAAMSAGTTFTASGNITSTSGNFVASDSSKHFQVGTRNLDEETVRVFADEASRVSAIPTPSVGRVTRVNTRRVLDVYSGSAWRPAQGICCLWATSSYDAFLNVGVVATVTPWNITDPPTANDTWSASGTNVTCLIAGTYMIFVSALLQTNSGTSGTLSMGRMYLDVNGGNVTMTGTAVRNGLGGEMSTIFAMAQLGANDTVSLRVESGNTQVRFYEPRLYAIRVF